MRKEYRVGLGIGGVLLTVAGVAVIVRSHTHNTPVVAKAQTGDKTDGDGTDPSAPADPSQTIAGPADPGTIPPVSEPTPPDVFDPAAKSGGAPGKTWEDAFANGQSAISTSTPLVPLHATDSHNGADTSASPLDRPFTPGTFPPPGLSAQPHTVVDNHPVAGRTHRVAQGENFYTIAKAEYGDGKYFLQIVKANPSINPQTLKIGQTIVLPAISTSNSVATTASALIGRHSSSHSGLSTGTTAVDSRSQYVVKSGDSLYRIAMRLYDSPRKVDEIYELNKDRIGPDRSRLKLNMVLKLPEAPTIASR